MGRGQVWGVHSCSAPINHQENKHNKIIIYPHTARPSLGSSKLQHPSQGSLVSGTALINIPPLCFIIVSFSIWITQNNPLCQPPRQQWYLFINLKSSLTPRDGRNTRASVIQYHCQSHFEDSYERAGRRAIKWWSSLQQVSTDSTPLKQRQQTWNKNRIGLNTAKQEQHKMILKLSIFAIKLIKTCSGAGLFWIFCVASTCFGFRGNMLIPSSPSTVLPFFVGSGILRRVPRKKRQGVKRCG